MAILIRGRELIGVCRPVTVWWNEAPPVGMVWVAWLVVELVGVVCGGRQACVICVHVSVGVRD